MKRRTPIWLLSAAAILLAGLAVLRSMKGDATYLSILRLNWDLAPPADCRLVYAADSGPSFHGDGERYHVFVYDSDLQWEALTASPPTEAQREAVREILGALPADEAFRPDFSAVTASLTLRKSDGSRLYLLYAQAGRILYVVEDIY